eukprot:6205180-Pleurochrysis_carterae.AAC.5
MNWTNDFLQDFSMIARIADPDEQQRMWTAYCRRSTAPFKEVGSDDDSEAEGPESPTKPAAWTPTSCEEKGQRRSAW